MDKETYLGDGLYASFDGWQVKLRAPRMDGDHEVYLEPSVIEAFETYLTELRAEIKKRNMHAVQS